jgi:hypothetical protein
MVRDNIYINKTVMARKRMLNKNEMIVASSLIAIPLTAVLVAMVTRRSRNRALKRSMLSRQASSETNTITNDTTTSASISITHNHYQKRDKEEEKAQSQPESPWQESETVEVPAPPVTTTSTISANTTSSDKDITVPAPLVVVVPSPMGPSNSVGKAMIPSPSRTPKEQEISVSDEARKAGESLKELIVAAIKGAKESAKGTGKRLKEETIDIAATTDSKDIQSLGDNVNTLVGLFEKTMVEIRKEHYNEQIKLLQSYKDLLQTQLKVVSARGTMASKLKPGA